MTPSGLPAGRARSVALAVGAALLAACPGLRPEVSSGVPHHEVVFVGDSIVDGLATATTTAPRLAAIRGVALGRPGDRIEGMVRRVQDGLLDGRRPSVVVLLGGTNHIRDRRVEDIVEGMGRLVAAVRARAPRARILVLAVPPIGTDMADPVHAFVARVNAGLEGLEQPPTVTFGNFNRAFNDPAGRVDEALFPDQVHPSPKGYARWMQAMLPTIDRLRAAPRSPSPP